MVCPICVMVANVRISRANCSISSLAASSDLQNPYNAIEVFKAAPARPEIAIRLAERLKGSVIFCFGYEIYALVE